jgi:hypothetical protein
MIRYALTCERSHAFDSWFRDSSAFDELALKGELSCPECGSSEVRKAMMAPALGRSLGADQTVAPIQTVAPMSVSTGPGATAEQGVALVDDGARRLREVARELHRRMIEGADDVGSAFPEEARRIHAGDVPNRSIYGQASRDEVKSMIEDGIPLVPLPSLPDDKH